MFKTLVNAFKVPEIRKKIFMTLLMIVIYRVGCHIPIPGVNASVIAQSMGSYDALGFLNLLSGGSFKNFTIFAMGISPYITGSIIVQLLQVAIPALEKMSKEEDGRKKLQQATRWTGVALSLVQSIGIVLSLGSTAVYNPNFLTYATIGIVATTGTCFLMWLGERITEVGVGNGISLLIFSSIASQVPQAIETYAPKIGAGKTYALWVVPVILIMVLLVITMVVFVNEGVRKIPVQYAKRVVGRKLYGGQSTHIPFKPNANGVMPLIFALTITQFPVMILQIADPTLKGGFARFWYTYMGTGSVVYYVIYALLILGFAYFYTTITFNPIELSKNLQQNGGFLPGIRPGKPTSDYLSRISHRLTLFGAVFLMILAIVPTAILGVFSFKSPFGPTSVLIVVSVALETIDQLSSQMLLRHYKGFLS